MSDPPLPGLARQVKLEAGPMRTPDASPTPFQEMNITPVEPQGIPWIAPTRQIDDNTIWVSAGLPMDWNPDTQKFEIFLAPSEIIGSNYIIDYGGGRYEVNIPNPGGANPVVQLADLIREMPPPDPLVRYIDAQGARDATRIVIPQLNGILPDPTDTNRNYMALDQGGRLVYSDKVTISTQSPPTWTWARFSDDNLPTGHRWRGIYSYPSSITSPMENDVAYIVRVGWLRYQIRADQRLGWDSPGATPSGWEGAITRETAQDQGINDIGSVIYDFSEDAVYVLTGWDDGTGVQTINAWRPVHAGPHSEQLIVGALLNTANGNQVSTNLWSAAIPMGHEIGNLDLGRVMHLFAYFSYTTGSTTIQYKVSANWEVDPWLALDKVTPNTQNFEDGLLVGSVPDARAMGANPSTSANYGSGDLYVGRANPAGTVADDLSIMVKGMAQHTNYSAVRVWLRLG